MPLPEHTAVPVTEALVFVWHAVMEGLSGSFLRSTLCIYIYIIIYIYMHYVDVHSHVQPLSALCCTCLLIGKEIVV
jgi:hypothetical protein